MMLIAHAGSVCCSVANAFATLEPRCAPNAHPYHSRPQAWTVSPDADADPCICAASRTAQVAHRNRFRAFRAPSRNPIPRPTSRLILPYQNTRATIPLNQADRILLQTGFSQPSWPQPHSPSARDGRPVLVIV